MHRLTPLALSLVAVLFLAGCADGNVGDMLSNPLGLGICGLIILVLDIIAIVEIFGSTRDTMSKVLWIAAIFFLPVLGLILYYFFGR